MFCDGCGNEASPGQQFCSKCGKAMAPMTVSGVHAGRVARHIQLLSILWVAYGMLALIGAIVVGIVAKGLFGIGGHLHDNPEVPAAFVHSLLTFIAFFVLCKSILAITTGAGLMSRAPWARTMAMVVSIIAMLNIPFGMGLGIYTLWVMMSPQSDEEYRKLATER